MPLTEHTRRICVALCGIAVLIGTALPAGAQTEATSEGDGADAADAVEDAEPAEPETAEAAPADDETGPVEEPSGALDAPTGEPAEETVADATEAEATGAPDAEQAAEADATDATDGAAEEEAPAPRGPALSFANSFLTWTHGMTFNSLAPGAQLTHNPTYYQSWSLTPRFYLTNTTFLWLNQGLTYELTDSDDTTYNHEPILTDTILDLRQNLALEGFVFQGQLRLGFPLSKASQSAGRILQTGVGLTITRPFPELASFTVSVTGGYRRWWATRTSPGIMGEPLYAACTSEGGMASFCNQAGAATNIRDLVLTGLILTVMPFAGFTVSFQGFYMGAYGDEIATAEVPINGGTETVVDDSPTHWRHFTYFALAVAYDVLPWLNLQLGIQNSGFVAPLYNPDGSVRSPFNPDTQIFLSATVGLDGLYNEIFGARDDGLTPEERQRRRQGLASRGSNSSF